jgi:hypothetical protein
MAQLRAMIDQSQEAATKEQLQFLVSAARGKLEEMQQRMERVFLNPASEEKIRVIPDTEIRWYEEYRCNVKSGASDELNKIVDSFFEGEKGLKPGFNTLIKSVLGTVLGNEAAGEQMKNLYVVSMEHNAVIRVDICTWRYNYTSDGIIGHVKDAFATTFCKSVVDHTKVHLDTLVYLISQQAGDELDQVKPYIAKLKEIWKLLEKSPANEVAERVQPLLRRPLPRLNSRPAMKSFEPA